MKKWLFWSVVLFAIVGMSSAAMARPIGVGAFAGLNIPIAQEDASTGQLYGARLRIAVAPFLALEPTLAYFQQGDASAQVGNEQIKLDGGQSTALGANLIVGSVGPPTGVRFYGVIGLASHAVKQEGTEDQNRLAMNLGPGLEVGVGDRLALDLEARLHMISLDGGGARKNLGLSGGLIFYLGN